jgi:Kef-type K+ transport system membrane component KefB
MIAGVVLGPSLLGLLFPDAQLALFPKETRNVLYAGAQLGVGLYMFMVGLTCGSTMCAARPKARAWCRARGLSCPL